MLHGKPLSGKSYTAEMLKQLSTKTQKYTVIKSVTIRYGNNPIDFTKECVDERLPATKKEKDQCQQALVKKAADQLSLGNNVILDATFHKRYRREWVYNLAKHHSANLVMVWMKLDDQKEIRKLLEERAANRDFKDNILYTWDQYMVMVEQYESLDENVKNIIKVDRDNSKIIVTGETKFINDILKIIKTDII